MNNPRRLVFTVLELARHECPEAACLFQASQHSLMIGARAVYSSDAAWWETSTPELEKAIACVPAFPTMTVSIRG